MPWDCRKCNEHVADDSVTTCPGCQTAKADWTLAADRTRNFVVPARKAELLVGTSRALVDAVTSYSGGRPVDRAPSVPATKALAWHKANKLPPPDCVLLVRLWVGEKETQVKLGLSIEWAAKAAETLSDREWKGTTFKPVASSDPKKKYLDARFLFVHGEEPWPKDRTFAGVEVIDVSEAGGPDGHAPRIGVAPFKQAKRIAVSLDAYAKGWADRLQCYELEFNHDSHLMKPEGLDVIYEVLRRSSTPAYKGKRLLVTGHTDSSGDEQKVNLPLSRRRCENIIHLLEKDGRSAWAASAADSYRRLVARSAKKAELDKDLIEQRFPAAAAKVGDWTSDAGWRVVFDAYEAELVRRGDVFEFTAADIQAVNALKTEPEKKKARRDLLTAFEAKKRAALDALRDGLQWVDPARKYVPCGERYLKVKTDADEKKELNRRDEFLWFPSDRLPWDPARPPADDEAAQAAVYGAATQQEWDYNTYDGPYTFDQLDCPERPEIPVPPDKAVFVIDCSGSMGGALRAGSSLTRIVACRRALQRVLRRIPAGNRFAMHWFNQDVGVYDTGELIKATQASIDDACLWVATLPIGGSTDTWSALERAMKVKDVARVLLLSDGVPTDRVTNEPAVLKRVREHTPRFVPIDTYGFLAVPDPTDETERLQVQQDRDTVGKKYTAQMEGVPEDQSVTLNDVLQARYAAVAKALNDERVKTAKGNTWTSTYVMNLLLGWFLAQLSKQTGADPFVDLTSRIP